MHGKYDKTKPEPEFDKDPTVRKDVIPWRDDILKKIFSETE